MKSENSSPMGPFDEESDSTGSATTNSSYTPPQRDNKQTIESPQSISSTDTEDPTDEDTPIWKPGKNGRLFDPSFFNSPREKGKKGSHEDGEGESQPAKRQKQNRKNIELDRSFSIFNPAPLKETRSNARGIRKRQPAKNVTKFVAQCLATPVKKGPLTKRPKPGMEFKPNSQVTLGSAGKQEGTKWLRSMRDRGSPVKKGMVGFR